MSVHAVWSLVSSPTMHAVRALHSEAQLLNLLDLHDPFNQQSLVKLELVLKGIKHYQAALGVKSRPRLPITPLILHKIKSTGDRKAADPDYVMLWAAYCLCFYGFLRAAVILSIKTTADINYHNYMMHEIRCHEYARLAITSCR